MASSRDNHTSKAERSTNERWEQRARPTEAPRDHRRTTRGRGSAARRPHTPAAGSNHGRAVGYTPYASANGKGHAGMAVLAKPQPTRRRHPKRSVIVVVAVVAVAGLALLLWHRRPVSVTVDGTTLEVANATRLAKVMDANGISVTAGNYVSVAGNVITQGGGYPFSAKVNGNELEGDDAESYRVSAGDDITLEDGTDRMEPYDTQVEDLLPTLKMDGNVGAINYVSQWGKAGKKEVRHGRDSGDTADGDTLEPAQDCVITVRDVHPDNDQKIVALTFDDGPAEKYTEAYLSILSQYGAKATFFELGKNVEQYPDLAKEVLDSGNEIMSHTQNHKQLTTLDEDDLKTEINDSLDAIRSATGDSVVGIRPPYGAFREGTWLKTGGCISLTVNWDKDSEDWRKPGADTIVSNATDGIEPGDIILMHDGGGERDQDVEALPKIIKTLQDQGYTVTTVSELLKSDSSIPANVADGSNTMPSDAVWPQEIDPEDLGSS